MVQAPEIVFPKLEEKTALFSPAALFVVLGSLLVVALAIITTLVASTRGAEVESINRKTQETDSQLKSGELAQLKTKLEAATQSSPELKATLQNRRDWQSLLSQMARSTVKSVNLVNLSFDGSSKLRVDGNAADFGAIAKQVASLRTLPAFASVEVVSLSRGISSISFSLNIELKLEQISLGLKPR